MLANLEHDDYMCTYIHIHKLRSVNKYPDKQLKTICSWGRKDAE